MVSFALFNAAAEPASVDLLVVNACPLIRVGLNATLERIRPGSKTVAVSNVAALEASAAQLDPRSLVILDTDSNMSVAAKTIREVRQRLPRHRIVVLAGDFDDEAFQLARDAGADGVINKRADLDAIAESLLAIHAGRLADPVYSRRQVAPTTTYPRLTARQHEVLGLLLGGLPNKTIARILKVSASTVKVHVSNVLRAYDARTRSEVVAKAYGNFDGASAGLASRSSISTVDRQKERALAS